VLGAPIGEGPGGAHASVGRWLFYGPYVLETTHFWSRKKKSTVTLALFFEEGKREHTAPGAAGRPPPSLSAAHGHAVAQTSSHAGGEASPGAVGGAGAPLCGLQAVRILQCNDRVEWCRKHSVRIPHLQLPAPPA
jgi:hypothetical protein